MEQISVEGQWNGQAEMLFNIPYRPHLHSSIEGNSYPKPLEYFLISLLCSITLSIKLEKITVKNLYLIAESKVKPADHNFQKIFIQIKLETDSSNQSINQLQTRLWEQDPLLKLFADKDLIEINWN